MTEQLRISPIDLLAVECQGYLDEAANYDDLNLMKELRARMADVIVVHRRKCQPAPSKTEPETFTFSDGITRNLTEMALVHAAHAAVEELPELSNTDLDRLAEAAGAIE